MTAIIKFESVSKKYSLGYGQESLREMLMRNTRRIFKASASNHHNYLMALKNVSFEVNKGQVLGIIGTNGAGKTTALKLLSRVSRPTTGNIQVQGRVSALIELGAGFHPDLTGRENVYLNGAILGLSQQEITKKFDSIVAFAELEKFIDVPVKRYSSGMYARLGFAVAAHVDPDVLLVDEVLAVGDINFQSKCYDFINSFVSSGRTTVFVSHNLFALEQLCQQIVWLDQGQVVTIGPASETLSAYMKAQDEKLIQLNTIENMQGSTLRIEQVFLTDEQNEIKREYHAGEDIIVNVEYDARQPVDYPHFVLSVWDAATRQPIFLASMLIDNQAPEKIFGRGRLSCRFKAPSLMPRAYQVWGEVWAADCRSILVRWQPLAAFSVVDLDQGEYIVGSLRFKRADAPVKIPYTWTLDDSMNSKKGEKNNESIELFRRC